jgi:hypothetical protein
MASLLLNGQGGEARILHRSHTVWVTNRVEMGHRLTHAWITAPAQSAIGLRLSTAADPARGEPQVRRKGMNRVAVLLGPDHEHHLIPLLDR